MPALFSKPNVPVQKHSEIKTGEAEPRVPPPTGALCGTCAWFYTARSECRFDPPYVLSPGTKTLWPTVSASDWCGRYANVALRAAEEQKRREK